MAEKEEVGIMGQIRRLSRRLSGTILSADARDVKAYLVRNDKKNIFSFNNEDQMQIGKAYARAGQYTSLHSLTLSCP